MRVLRVISLSLFAVLIASCATSPTGQHQLLLFPDSEIAKMGATAFEETKKRTPPSKDVRLVAYVQCVASALTRQVASSTQWEVQVFESPDINAFALPGGKIGVYTGILKVASNQHQLAAILGHEVEHVLANHGNARISAAYAAQGALALTQTLAGAPSPMKDNLFGLLGVGAQYGVLMPYGRGQETEADVLGLNLMARAGFDPREAVQLWRNMSQAAGGKSPPAFLSTHPAHETRIQVLSQRMPEAMRIYEAARQSGRRPDCPQP